MIIKGYEIDGRMPLFQRWGRDAIREGKKFQTRRTRGLEFLTYDHAGIPICDWGLSEKPRQYDGKERLWRWQGSKPPKIGDWFVVLQSDVDDNETIPLRCPYKPGEIRVMREPLKTTPEGWAQYADDGKWVKISAPPPLHGLVEWRWKRDTLSQMFMPTAYGRTLCEITDIRAERLQDISRADAKQEGFWPGANGLEQACGRSWGNAQLAFQAIWDSINGPGAWERNNMVWVPSFKKLK